MATPNVNPPDGSQTPVVVPESNTSYIVDPVIIFKTGGHRYHRGTHNGRRVIFKYCIHEPWTEFEGTTIETLESMDRLRHLNLWVGTESLPLMESQGYQTKLVT